MNGLSRESDPFMSMKKFLGGAAFPSPALAVSCGLAALILLAAACPAPARTPVDGIAAVVNGTPILFSEVEELRFAMQQQRPGFASLSDAEQRLEAMNRLVDDKVLLEKAGQDTMLRV